MFLGELDFKNNACAYAVVKNTVAASLAWCCRPDDAKVWPVLPVIAFAPWVQAST